MNHLFMELPYECEIYDELVSLCNTTTFDKYYNFDCKQVDRSLFSQDKFLYTLYNKIPFRCAILKMHPNYQYAWHVDSDRMCGINMLIKPFNSSLCLFATPDDDNLVNFKTTELNYKKNKYYSFNTQVPHMVQNLSEDRYLFSIEFNDSDLSYSDLNNQLINL